MSQNTAKNQRLAFANLWFGKNPLYKFPKNMTKISLCKTRDISVFFGENGKIFTDLFIDKTENRYYNSIIGRYGLWAVYFIIIGVYSYEADY